MKTSKKTNGVHYSVLGWFVRRASRAVVDYFTCSRRRRVQAINSALAADRAKHYDMYKDDFWGAWAVWVDGGFVGLVSRERANMYNL